MTATTEATVYLYKPSNLWVAYGLAILFGTFSVLVGSHALWRNGVSYDACISTFAIAMQHEEVGNPSLLFLRHIDWPSRSEMLWELMLIVLIPLIKT